MDFSRLNLLLRLPLAALVCGLLFGFYGNVPSGDSFAISMEVGESFDARDEKKSLDDGLPAAIFKLALIEHLNRVSLNAGIGYVPRIVFLELHATGPPTV